MLRIGIVAGESSGDILGAGLLNAIKMQNHELQVEGIGGNKMIEAGMNSLYTMDKLSVMGFTEVVGRFFELHSIRKRLRAHFLKNPPDIFIGIDAPDFNLWLEKELRTAGIKTVHYVSPSVWAWREYRVKKIQQSVDLMLNLFPFESDFYDKHNVPNKFVGHPLADELADKGNTRAARQELGLPEEKKIVAILPGSRINEVNKIASPLLIAAEQATCIFDDLHFVSGFINKDTNDRFKMIKQQVAPDLQIDMYIGKTHRVMEAADVIMLASGTATLEAMLLQKPMIVAYRLSWITYYIVKALAKIPYASLPNILADKKIIPECLQGDCTADKILSELNKLLIENNNISTIQKEFARLSTELKKNANEIAAKSVLDLIGKNKVA